MIRQVINNIKKFIIYPIIQKHTFHFAFNDIKGIDTSAELTHSSLIGGTRFILKGDHMYFQCSTKALRQTLTNKLVLQESQHCNFVFQHYNTKIISIHTKVSKLVIKGNTVSCLHPCSNNFYHFCIEALYDLISSIIENKKIHNVVVNYEVPIHFLKIIKTLLPHVKMIRIKTSQLIFVEKLYSYADHNFQCAWSNNGSFKPINYLNTEWLHKANKIFTSIVPNFSKTDQCINSICILIRKSKHRITVNEKELAKVVFQKYHNSTVIYPENNLHRTIKILNESSVIMMQSGAAIANLMFVKKRKTVLLWQYMSKDNDLSLITLAQNLGHKVYAINAKPVFRSAVWHADLKTKYQADLFCNIDEIMKTLQKHFDN